MSDRQGDYRPIPVNGQRIPIPSISDPDVPTQEINTVNKPWTGADEAAFMQVAGMSRVKAQEIADIIYRERGGMGTPIDIETRDGINAIRKHAGLPELSMEQLEKLDIGEQPTGMLPMPRDNSQATTHVLPPPLSGRADDKYGTRPGVQPSPQGTSHPSSIIDEHGEIRPLMNLPHR